MFRCKFYHTICSMLRLSNHAFRKPKCLHCWTTCGNGTQLIYKQEYHKITIVSLSFLGILMFLQSDKPETKLSCHGKQICCSNLRTAIKLMCLFVFTYRFIRDLK